MRGNGKRVARGSIGCGGSELVGLSGLLAAIFDAVQTIECRYDASLLIIELAMQRIECYFIVVVSSWWNDDDDDGSFFGAAFGPPPAEAGDG